LLPLWLPLLIIAPFIGSFLGTLIVRLPESRPVLVARSRCDRCGAALGPLELVPLASWLVLRGRCRHCGAAIGSFPVAIELAALGVVAWAATVTTGPVLVASCVLGWLLLTLALIDWRHFLLPDPLNAVLALGGLIAAWFFDRAALADHLIALAAGFAVFAALGFAYRRWRGRDGLGLGDAKLLGALGAWVSWQGLPSVVLFGAVSGLVVAFAAAFAGRHLSATTRIPFGAFLALGGWIVWLYGPLIVNLPAP
jgi:leader peptidase (prepilin peptidase) / N-methyltransferase